jgi:glutamate-1-semialdehyde 2,1-aminomutase
MSWMDDLYEHDPVWVSQGHGAYFTDVDGHEYLDMYVADMSAFCGHAPEPVVTAVSRRMAHGNQFLLPSEDAVVVSEHLSGRYRMPQWQFTSSATQANTEVIRIAREITGRDAVVVFDGKYHGHLDPTLVVIDGDDVVAEYKGLASDIPRRTRVVPFNDVDALSRALADHEVAVVLTEPAMTNAGFLLPQPGFHAAVRSLTREHGTLLAIDETHSLVCSYAGLTGRWDLDPDMFTVGKAIAAGVPLAAYGMTDVVAGALDPPDEPYNASGAATGEVATGGTLFANALSMAAGRAALIEVLTPAAFARTEALGQQLAAGLRELFAGAGLHWSVVQEGAHAAYFFEPDPPRNGAGSRQADDPALRAMMRVYLANRGVWESGWWLGPTVSVAHGEADVESYLTAMGELVSDITS